MFYSNSGYKDKHNKWDFSKGGRNCETVNDQMFCN